MKISIASSLYSGYPLDETIRRTAAAGYDGIDIWGGRPHVYRQDFSGAELAGLRRLVEGCGLTVNSFMPAFFRYPYNLLSPNDVMRRDTLAYVRESLDNAAALGANTLLVCCGRRLWGQSEADAWERMSDSLGQICEWAKPLGMKVGLEAVNRFVFDLVHTAADALRMIEPLHQPHLGVVLDTGHQNLCDEPAPLAVELLGSRLLQVHFNDNDGKRQQNLVPGDGSFDFAGFIAALRGSGYDGFISAELSQDYANDPDAAARLAAKRMRAMLAEG